MAGTKNHLKKAAANARAAKACKSSTKEAKMSGLLLEHEAIPVSDDFGIQNTAEECGWDGMVNHILSSDNDSEFDDETDESDFGELEGNELIESLELGLAREVEQLCRTTPYGHVTKNISSQQWKEAESV